MQKPLELYVLVFDYFSAGVLLCRTLSTILAIFSMDFSSFDKSDYIVFHMNNVP